MYEELLGLKETAKRLNIHVNTLRNWDKSGYLKAVRMGARNDRRFRLKDIERLENFNH